MPTKPEDFGEGHVWGIRRRQKSHSVDSTEAIHQNSSEDFHLAALDGVGNGDFGAAAGFVMDHFTDTGNGNCESFFETFYFFK